MKFHPMGWCFLPWYKDSLFWEEILLLSPAGPIALVLGVYPWTRAHGSGEETVAGRPFSRAACEFFVDKKGIGAKCGIKTDGKSDSRRNPRNPC